MTVMRKLVLMPLLAAAVFLGAAEAKADKVFQLFNGADLSNWTGVFAKPEVKMEDVFTVRDGYLTCKGEPLGFIQTNRKFVNFKLIVEYRWAPGTKPGNSGIFLRINGQPSPLPRCIECQLKSGDAGDLYGFHGMKIDGDKARRTEQRGHEIGGDFTGIKKRFSNENKAGRWNRAEITINGRDLTVRVNDRVVNEAKDCEWVVGPVGLQSEGGEIQFRKVELTTIRSN